MLRLRIASGALALAAIVLLPVPARAEADTVRIARQYGIGYLQIVVMEHEKLLEKHAKALGLSDVKVVWNTYADGTVANDGVLSGNLDFVAGGLGSFVTLWDRTRGLLDVKGVAALNSIPMLLNTRNPNVRTIRDLTDADRIALAGVKVSSQAVEAAIVESESRFNLNSRALLQLADAGVSRNVIDLMVAQSFPSHFRVERPLGAPLTPVATAFPPTISMPGAVYPYPYGGYYDPFDYYGYYGLYYSPFAYPYYWGSRYYNSPRYYITNGSAVYVNGGSIISGGGRAIPSSSNGRGQVVNGQGYTRVHTGAEQDNATATDSASASRALPPPLRASANASASCAETDPGSIRAALRASSSAAAALPCAVRIFESSTRLSRSSCSRRASRNSRSAAAKSPRL